MATQAAGIFSPAITTAASTVKKLHLFSTTHRPKSLPIPKTAICAEKTESSAPAVKEEAPVGFTPPQLDPNTPSPIFAGSTGGLLRKAQVEEFYVITWNSPKEQIFEMPTGGAAINERRAESVEASEERTVSGFRYEVEIQVQDQLSVLQSVPQRRGSVSSPKGRSLSRESESS